MGLKHFAGCLGGLTLAALAAAITPAVAAEDNDKVMYSAALSGSEEVPATSSTGTGNAEVVYDTGEKKLTWKITFSGLTGPAIAAHFHGPAAHGANAGVAVPIPGTANPLEGSATLTAAQATDLAAGKWYVNIHTTANQGCEIRGWLAKK